MTESEKQELRKSCVRVRVTYIASTFLFGGAAVLMVFKPDEAKDIFFTVVPVATGIISYWFATRGKGIGTSSEETGKGERPQSGKNENEKQI